MASFTSSMFDGASSSAFLDGRLSVGEPSPVRHICFVFERLLMITRNARDISQSLGATTMRCRFIYQVLIQWQQARPFLHSLPLQARLQRLLLRRHRLYQQRRRLRLVVTLCLVLYT